MPARLSVVMVVGDRRERAVGALASVLGQEGIDDVEIVLLDLATEARPVEGSADTHVRIVPLPAGTLFSVAKAHGVRLATAPVVVFLEEHVRVWPGWARALMDGYDRPCGGIGPEVHNGNPESWISRYLEVLNYHESLPPAAAGPAAILPGHNSSFRREVLLGYGDELVDLMRAELVLHLRLRRDGHELRIEPAARISHINETSFGSATRGRFLWNRCYGAMRVRAFGWSRGRRLFYAAAMPLIPLYTLARLIRYGIRRRPAMLPRVIAGAPLLLAVQLASAAGHTAGVLFGIGRAEAGFSQFEMNEFRRYREPVRTEAAPADPTGH